MIGKESKEKTIKEYKDNTKYTPQVQILMNQIYKNTLEKIDILRVKQIIAKMEPRTEINEKVATINKIY